MSDSLPPALQALADRIDPAWGDTVDVGPGWFDLLTRLDARLAAIAPRYVIEQCKTKFGTLRFYARDGDPDQAHSPAFTAAVRDAEDDSAIVCEDCGALAGPVVINGWVWTLCPAHAGLRTASRPAG